MKQTLIKASKVAAKVLMKNYGKIKFVKTKEKESYFTNVDLEAEKAIFSIIRKQFPRHNIVSEEYGNLGKKSEYTWYIDPLDGTHNYIHNIPLFGVSIALAYKDKVKLGILNIPCLKEIYFAEKGKGAFLNGKRIKVSNKKTIKKSFVVTDISPRRMPEAKIKIYGKLKNNAYDIRALGTAIYGQALIARGSADIFITKETKSWDIAAGFLLIEEAQGKVTDFKSNNWKPKDGSYIATNGHLHNKILNILNV